MQSLKNLPPPVLGGGSRKFPVARFVITHQQQVELQRLSGHNIFPCSLSFRSMLLNAKKSGGSRKSIFFK
jgi:hypothetical protein